MLEGKTKSGFAFSVEEEALDDYELLEAVCGVDNGDYEKITTVVDMLLGEEQKNALKAHLRANGRVSAKRMISEVVDIFQSCNAGKNS